MMTRPQRILNLHWDVYVYDLRRVTRLGAFTHGTD
jgi:hypothetical protein